MRSTVDGLTKWCSSMTTSVRKSRTGVHHVPELSVMCPVFPCLPQLALPSSRFGHITGSATKPWILFPGTKSRTMRRVTPRSRRKGFLCNSARTRALERKTRSRTDFRLCPRVNTNSRVGEYLPGFGFAPWARCPKIEANRQWRAPGDQRCTRAPGTLPNLARSVTRLQITLAAPLFPWSATRREHSPGRGGVNCAPRPSKAPWRFLCW
jgi:hypothetical protein